jgi:hypothetical protein
MYVCAVSPTGHGTDPTNPFTIHTHTHSNTTLYTLQHYQLPKTPSRFVSLRGFTQTAKPNHTPSNPTQVPLAVSVAAHSVPFQTQTLTVSPNTKVPFSDSHVWRHSVRTLCARRWRRRHARRSRRWCSRGYDQTLRNPWSAQNRDGTRNQKGLPETRRQASSVSLTICHCVWC